MSLFREVFTFTFCDDPRFWRNVVSKENCHGCPAGTLAPVLALAPVPASLPLCSSALASALASAVASAVASALASKKKKPARPSFQSMN